MKHKVFVYGTLKRGYSNYNRLLRTSEFVSEAKTLPKYRLYDVGMFPCMVKDGERGVAVEGEVFIVDDETKQRLDWLEGISSGMYTREVVELEGVEGPVEAYFWGRSPKGLRDIGSKWPANDNTPKSRK